MSVGTVAELLQLHPYDLGELLADAAPGELPEVQAAALGLDLAIPDHRNAVIAALPQVHPEGCNWSLHMQGLVDADCKPVGQVEPDLPPVSAGHVGVRSDLTPDELDGPGPDDDQDEPGDGRTGLLSPAQLRAVLDEYRGRPEPFIAGTFAAYVAPDGSIVLVTESERGLSRQVVPAKFVKVGIGMVTGGGNPFKRLLGR